MFNVAAVEVLVNVFHSMETGQHQLVRIELLLTSLLALHVWIVF
jgi:hypothetical protein